MDLKTHLRDALSLKEGQIEGALRLLEEGRSVPFIARYRKEETGNLSDNELRELVEEKERYEKLEERREAILKSLREQNLLSPELEKSVLEAATLPLLEAVYRPYRPKRKTRGSVARERGLSPLAELVKKQTLNEYELLNEAERFVNAEKDVATKEEALQGALDILAEEIADNSQYYLDAKSYIYKRGRAFSKETKEDVEKRYLTYDQKEIPLERIRPHQTLALLRGKREKKLQVSIKYDEMTIENAIARDFIRRDSKDRDLLLRTIKDAFDRLLAPSLENEIWNELFEKAQDASLLLFRDNMKQLLLASPLKGGNILGFDPGYRNGCKLALIDTSGNVLETAFVYPTVGKERDAERTLESLYKKHGFKFVALGNGTASRESEAFLDAFKKSHPEMPFDVLVVSESGASVYSASPLAIQEFPSMDVDLRSAVSLARRLQDPMAELVKIPPESLGVGQYQHDMDEKRLKATLEAASIDAVNEVGVWLNTASFSLLKNVAGLSAKNAMAIVAYRQEKGAFKTREELRNVKGIGPKTYEDAVGFLRIENENPLEKTGVHPRDYDATAKLLSSLGLSLSDLGNEKASKRLEGPFDYQSLEALTGLGEYTLKDILQELRKPGRDPREKGETAALSQEAKDIKDLKEGMVLTGTVRNISDFGAFVDIGVHQDGLIHVSQMADHYVKNPRDYVSLGQILKVKILSVDLERKRISLTLKGLESGK